MKSFAGLGMALEVAKFTCWILLAVAGGPRAAGGSIPFHYVGFEKIEGYQAGVFKGSDGGLQLLQGDARIIRDAGDEAGQCLETLAGHPYASIHFQGKRVSRNHKTYYEVWVRPSASPMEKSEEFMDFDGAVLGFFADGPNKPATFHAYHALPEHQGYWVSTGVSAAVGPSGMTQDWIRIGICQNLATGTWDLEIGGEAVLSEIRNTETPREDGIELWLLGHETHANHFDDLLVSPVEPDSLRLGETKPLPKGRSSKHGAAGNLDRTGVRKVGRKQSDEDRRRHDAGLPAGLAKRVPKSFDFEMDIVSGGTQCGKVDAKDSGTNQGLLFYSAQYDKDGKPLPLKVQIRCDSELAEGVDLSKILWAVTEHAAKNEKKPLKVIAHGTFKTGFTQIAEIPSEWADQVTQTQVGTDLGLGTLPLE